MSQSSVPAWLSAGSPGNDRLNQQHGTNIGYRRNGQVIPTGAERADGAEAKARRLAERLQAMGINPDVATGAVKLKEAA